MLPILITIVVVGAVLGGVYLIGARPSQQASQKGPRARATGSAAGGTRRPARSAFAGPPPWLRRLPLLLVIGAVVCLVIAVAQFRVAKSKATPVIALVIDSSNSMDAQDVSPSRLVAAQSAAQLFLQRLPEEFEVALVTFADDAAVLEAPTPDQSAVSTALGDLPRGSGTVIGDGLSAAIDEIETAWSTDEPGPAAIVLLSDGRDTGSEVPPLDAAARAAARGIPVYTVVLGTSGEGGRGANVELLQQIAASTGATSSTADSAGELSDVYGELGSQLSSQLKISNSAQLFVFLAIALAMGAAIILLYVTLKKQG